MRLYLKASPNRQPTCQNYLMKAFENKRTIRIKREEEFKQAHIIFYDNNNQIVQ
jgi:hypothetical protein